MSNLQQIFFGALQQSIHKQKLSPIIETLIEVLIEKDIIVDRLQLPMNEVFGFRHPQYRSVVLTWEEGNFDVLFIPHTIEDAETMLRRVMKDSPFRSILLDGNDHYRCRLGESNPYEILNKLQRKGYTDYFNFAIPLPHGATQICSIATKQTSGFLDDIVSIISEFRYLLSFAIYGYYQSFVSNSVARTYLGKNTGTNVLAGKMFRGKQETLDAGILFCDIRGFTKMSEQLGGEKIIEVVNQVFQIVGEEIEVYGGEILKFIGDALLIIFPRAADISNYDLSKGMIAATKKSRERVEALAIKLDLPIGIGFGGHIGEVQYGNIGTQNRLDFTVMGPAVNLASRIESMCKSLDAYLTLSAIAAEGWESDLEFLGDHSLKGVDGAIAIWGLRNETI